MLKSSIYPWMYFCILAGSKKYCPDPKKIVLIQKILSWSKKYWPDLKYCLEFSFKVYILYILYIHEDTIANTTTKVSLVIFFCFKLKTEGSFTQDFIMKICFCQSQVQVPGQVRSRSGPGQVPGQVQKVQGLRTKDLDLG